MLSYQHSYHAGHAADVVKHAALALLLARLTAKPAPVWYAETHAGRGAYPLTDPHVSSAQGKTQSFKHGLAPLIPNLAHAPAALAPYRQALAPYLSENIYAEQHIPGSPAVARTLLREQDTLHLCERHPQEVAALRQFVKGDTRIKVHAADGHATLPTLLAKEQPARSLILIDPAYELKDEYADVCRTVAALLKLAPKVIIMVWYPLLTAGREKVMTKNLAAYGVPATWQADVKWADPLAPTGQNADQINENFKGAHGTGLLILNLPYQLDHDLETALDWLLPHLKQTSMKPNYAAGFVTPA